VLVLLVIVILLCCWCDRRRQRNFDVVQDAVVGSCKLEAQIRLWAYSSALPVALNQNDIELQPVVVPLDGHHGGESTADTCVRLLIGR
jgi:hypothetical protein